MVTHASTVAAALRQAGASPMTPADPTSAWVAAARLGDRKAYGRLYERHAAMVHAVVLSRVPRDAAADLVHDVFLHAMERLASLREDAAFAPWIATIARRRAIDWRRRQRPTLELLDTHATTTPGDAPDEQAALSAVRALPEAYRETLMLRFALGLSGPEIAERTGMTPGSVRVNLHRGIRMLRERWRGDDDA